MRAKAGASVRRSRADLLWQDKRHLRTMLGAPLRPNEKDVASARHAQLQTALKS